MLGRSDAPPSAGYRLSPLVPIATRRMWLCAVVAGALFVFLIMAAAVLPERAALVVVHGGASVCILSAVVGCFWTGGRARGAERRWRLLIGLTAVGALGANTMVVQELVAGGYALPRLSAEQAGFFVLYALALAGLLALPTDPLHVRPSAAQTPRRDEYRWYAITVFDSLLVVGSLSLLAWGTVLSKIVKAGAPDTGQFLLFMVNPVAGLVLTVAVVLLASFRRPRVPAELAFLGAGLLAFSLTADVFLYVAATGERAAPAATGIGFVAGWLLITMSTLVPASHPARRTRDRAGPRATWAHAVLPYLALGAAGALVVGKLLTGSDVDRIETYGLVGLLLTALARQMMTLAENTRLLARVQVSERQLHHQAFHDPLTGLVNRAGFAERLQQALTRRARERVPVALLFFDLDDFKHVNDAFGHAAGDELLKIVAGRLCAGVRTVDTVARLGGDEFAVILDGSNENPDAVGRRLAGALHAPCLLAGHLHTVHASLGLVVADAAADPVDPDSLLHHADLAMYAAKQQRKGTLPRAPVEPAQPGSAPADLARALRGEPTGGTVDVRYRPVVDLRDGRTTAVHAYLHWSHPQFGDIDPQQMLGSAEDDGLAAVLDALVLARTCDDLDRWRADGGTPVPTLVSISPDRAADTRLPDEVTDLLRRHHLPPSCMILTLTDTGRVTDLKAAAHVLGRLAAQGVRLAIANLGSAPHPLTALLVLPIQFVILDPAITGFTCGTARSNQDGQTPRGIFAAAEQLHLTAIAAGADSRQDVLRLAAEGCTYAEGHCFGPPGPFAAVVSACRSRSPVALS